MRKKCLTTNPFSHNLLTLSEVFKLTVLLIFFLFRLCAWYLEDAAVSNERNPDDKADECDELEDDESDVPDNELGVVMEFDEDELDEAQTEVDVKNIVTKHQMTIEELKREVLGSVRANSILKRKCLVRRSTGGAHKFSEYFEEVMYVVCGKKII